MSLTFAGVTIESRTSDNFINATQMCKVGGRKFNDWHRLSNTHELIELVGNQVGGISRRPPIDVVTDGPVKLRGSWIHPDLAVQLAQWISPAFALQVSRWIRELYTEGSVQIAASNSTKTDDFKRLEQRNLQLEEELKKRDHLVEYTKSIENELAVHIFFDVRVGYVQKKNTGGESGACGSVQILAELQKQCDVLLLRWIFLAKLLK
jgi:hypothetical protein